MWLRGHKPASGNILRYAHALCRANVVFMRGRRVCALTIGYTLCAARVAQVLEFCWLRIRMSAISHDCADNHGCCGATAVTECMLLRLTNDRGSSHVDTITGSAIVASLASVATATPLFLRNLWKWYPSQH